MRCFRRSDPLAVQPRDRDMLQSTGLTDARVTDLVKQRRRSNTPEAAARSWFPGRDKKSR